MSPEYDPMDACDPVAAALAAQWDAEHGATFLRERIQPIFDKVFAPTDPSPPTYKRPASDGTERGKSSVDDIQAPGVLGR